MKTCSCHSKKLFAECCEPFLLGLKTPSSPLELMQSRFSAYVNMDKDYLLRTWEPSTRPQTLELSRSTKWLSLNIIHTSPHENHGVVEFKSTYSQENTTGILHETSRFIRTNGIWFYVDGDLHEPQSGKPGRNTPCPCGSGHKFKKCCI